MSKSEPVPSAGTRFARRVDWNLFKVFYEIGRQGGIGAAARALAKQQPSISAALKRLEGHIGTPLCTRTAQGVELTIHGHEVLEACQSMYMAVQALNGLPTRRLEEIEGSVSLRLISNLYLVPGLTAILKDFHDRFPRIEVRLDVAPWRAVLRSIKAADVELAIGFEDTPDERIMYVPVFEQIQQVYCGPQHPLFGKAPVTPERLVNEPFVITQDEPTAYVQYRQRHGLGRRVGATADNLQERMWLIQMGMGVGLLPQPVVEASSFAKVLWPMLAPDEAPVCTIYLMASAKGIRSAPAQLLLETALAHLEPAERDLPRA